MIDVMLTGIPILLLDGLFSDMILVLKIFTLMAIIAFVMQHLGKGPLAILIIVGISWFVVFDYFAFFGGIYVLWILLSFGLTGVIIDFFFVNPGGGVEKTPGISTGGEFMARQAQMQKARRGR